ncbi:MAG: hypothetical protein JSW61_11315 [Candidatus Thorarchaeota archaeon]|nr:MAG: hypothetical protein JSW61_11315 [Candidatus Thorarchaeota archaeon]
MTSDTVSVESLLSRAELANDVEKMRILELLGQRVKFEHSRRFEAIVRDVIGETADAEIDIENWRVIALKIVLLVAREKELQLSLKCGERLTTIVRYPESEAMVKEFARAIVHGEL